MGVREKDFYANFVLKSKFPQFNLTLILFFNIFVLNMMIFNSKHNICTEKYHKNYLNMSSQTPYTFDKVIRFIISIAIIAIIIFLINYIKAALLPFLVAWLLAYFLNPAVEFFRVKLRFRNKVLSIITVLTLVVGFISLILVVSLPSITKEIGIVVNAANKYLSDNTTTGVPAWLQDYLRDNLNFKDIMSKVKDYNLSEIINKLLAWVWGVVSGSLNIAVSIVTSLVVILYLVFILKDFDNISTGALGLIPPKYRGSVSLVMSDVSNAMNRYFRGQALVAASVGILFAIGFTIIGLPLGFALGLFIGMLNMVPYLQLLGILPMAILSLVKCIEGNENFLFVFGLALGVMAIVQLIQDTFIVPKIMGKVSGLNPAIILLSLSIWGVTLGVIGMIIALPMTSLLLSYYKRFIIEGNPLTNDATLDKKGE